MITYHAYTVERKNGKAKIYREGSCLSTDTKPTNDATMMNGSKLMEMNTGKLFLYDEANKVWREWT